MKPLSEVRKSVRDHFTQLLEREETNGRMDSSQYLLIALTLRDVEPELAVRFLALAGEGLTAERL